MTFICKKSTVAAAVAAVIGFPAVASAASEIDIQPSAAGGAAFASDLDTAGTTSGAVTIDSLWTDDERTVDLGAMAAGNDYPGPNDSAAGGAGQSAGDRSVVYSSDVALVDGTTLGFTLTNCEVPANAGLALLGWDTVGGTFVTLGSLNDFDDSDGDGDYNFIKFQIDTDALAGTENFSDRNGAALGVTATGDPLPAGIALMLSEGTAGVGAEDLAVITDAGLSAGDSCSIQVTQAQDASGVPLTAPKTSSKENLVTVVDAVSGSINAVTSVIDVEFDPTREGFVDALAAADGTDTNTDLSRATLNISNTAEYGLTLAGSDTWTFTVARDNNDNVIDVDIASGASANTANAAGEYVISNDFNTQPLADGDAININTDDSGTGDPMAVGPWTTALNVELAADGSEPAALGQLELIAATNSHIWNINGAQVKVTYLPLNATGFVTFMKVVNEDSNDANVQIDAIIENITQGTSTTVSSADLGTVSSKGNATFGEADVKAALGLNDDDLYHVFVTLTAVAPQNSIHVSAYTKDAAGRTAIPVLYNTNNNNDGRSWQ